MKYEFYHVCKSGAVESVLKNGLLRSKSTLWKKSGGAIYLTDRKGFVANFQGGDDTCAILKVTLPKDWVDDTEIWHIDSYDGIKPLDAPGEWQYIVWEDIPPKFIELIEMVKKDEQ